MGVIATLFFVRLLAPRRLRRAARRIFVAGLLIYAVNSFFNLSKTAADGITNEPTNVIESPYNSFQYIKSFTEKADKEESKSETRTAEDEFLEYSGKSSIDINGGVPYFTSQDLTTVSYEDYGSLDSLGRCSSVIACLSKDTMPVYGEERGEIGMIKPTGWHTIKYDCIEDRYLYNRCHLIGWQLGAENDNELNLVTGTRYMNLEMTDTENLVAKYIRRTGNHVLYRVTPIFKDNELVCRGLLIEAQSVEDDEISICKFYHNVQPGISIDYTTGDSEYTDIFLDEHGQSVISK